MSIRNKLLLATLSQLLLVIVFSVFTVVSSGQISRISNSQTKATDIVKTITEIRFVTFENLLNHDKDSFDQWQSKHNELRQLVAAYPASNSQEKALLDDISEQQVSLEPLFDKLHTSYSDTTPTTQSVVAQNQYQERLASQIISKQQIEITDAFKLADLKNNQEVALRQRTSSLAVVIIVLMFLITVINFVFVFASISKALVILQRGANNISKGKLDYRIKFKRSNDEFGSLASAFNHMASSVEQLDRVKSEFVLLVSHQLRTPATAVKGFLSLFQDHYSGSLSSKQNELLQFAYDENERQIKLINEILAVAQYETNDIELHIKSNDLLKLVKNVVAEQQMVLESRNQQATIVQSAVMPEAEIDADKFRIVVENFLHNASKFSPPGSQIMIRLSATDKVLVISVSDKGPGLSQAEIDTLFKKFAHVSKPGIVEAEGAGLGLYLAKTIAELHRGKIIVTSTVGEGSTFTVQLPKSKQS